MKKSIIAILLACCFSLTALAEDKIPIGEKDYANHEVEMADTMRSSGKIYVVVATLSVILGGMFFYLVSVDKKVAALEKEIK